MDEPKDKDIQEIVSWIKKKSPEPWEVLYRVVTDQPDLVIVKVSPLLRIKWSGREMVKSFWADIRRKPYGVPTEELGGELLTRLPEEIVRASSNISNFEPREFVGKVFKSMPVEKMDEILLPLIRRQLQHINNSPPLKYFSINLEAPKADNHYWQDLMQLFLDKGSQSVAIELVERREFPTFAQYDLANVCREVNTRISVDDLGSKVHNLATTEGEEYLRGIITILGGYLTTFKMDYDIVKKMHNNLSAVGQVGYNLTAVAWLWLYSARGRQLPSVTFESMPRNDRRWLLAIQKICTLFEEVLWQID